MKPLAALAAALLLLAAAPAVAQQDEGPVGQDKNLAGVTVCIDPENMDIDLDNPGALNADRLATRLYAELERRLTADGVRHATGADCDGYDAWITVAGTGGSTRAILAQVTLEHFANGNYPSWATVWSYWTVATANQTGAALEDRIFNLVRDEIEELASAWVKANP